MKIKYVLLLMLAIFIDCAQIALGWIAFAVGAGLQALTPVGGAVGGAVAGAAVCWSSSGGIIAGIVDAAKCGIAGGILGAGASAFGIPLGMVLGFVFDVLISLTLGSALIMFLIFFGMYSSTRTLSGLIFEIIPGLDVLPGWTLMVGLSILKDRAKGKNDLVSKATKVAFAATSITSINPLAAARGAVNMRNAIPRNEAPSRVPENIKSPRMANEVIPRNVANDTRPYVQKTA